jgi:hypothetical protein
VPVRALIAALALAAAVPAASAEPAQGDAGRRAAGPEAARSAALRSCRPVVNPYPGTRYEGADLRGIRAAGMSCRTARRVARRAHRKALGQGVPADGVRRFRWRRWNVTGDLRGATDRYLAKARGGRRVRWLF